MYFLYLIYTYIEEILLDMAAPITKTSSFISIHSTSTTDPTSNDPSSVVPNNNPNNVLTNVSAMLPMTVNITKPKREEIQTSSPNIGTYTLLLLVNQ
jgi:hypothetical protein